MTGARKDEEEENPFAILEGWVTDHVNGTTTLRLQYPIGTAESPINELRVARPRAKHIRRFDDAKPQVAQILEMAEDLSDLTLNQVDALDAADAMRLVTLIGRDFASGLDGTSGAR